MNDRHYRDDLIEHVESHLQDLIRDAQLNGWNPNVYATFRILNGAWIRAYRESGHTISDDGYDGPFARDIPTAIGFRDERVRPRR